jgi:uncharacterized membrane protein YbhN (UPF0104 family)
MIEVIKKIFKSKWFKISISLILIFLAFRKVNMISLFHQLVGIKVWFLVLNIIICFLLSALVSFRWSLLLIKKPKFKDIWVFTKSSFAASFYGLFLPTSVAGDFLKWIIVDEKYPEISKTKILGSVVLDRIIGLSMYMFLGLIMIVVALCSGVKIPLFIVLIFIGLFLGCLVFYVIIYCFNSKVDGFFKFKFLKRFENISELVKKENLVQITKCLALSSISEFVWVLQIWFISCYFGANLSFLSILVFLPVISMILILPISIAGFGAREQLYLFFFAGTAASPESLLLTSAFTGILGIINALIGGLMTLTPDFKKLDKK